MQITSEAKMLLERCGLVKVATWPHNTSSKIQVQVVSRRHSLLLSSKAFNRRELKSLCGLTDPVSEAPY